MLALCLMRLVAYYGYYNADIIGQSLAEVIIKDENHQTHTTKPRPSQTVFNKLLNKHPLGKPVHPEVL